MLGSGALLPIHWGTFNLAVHPWDEPADTLLRLAPAAGIHLVMPRIGEPVEPARIDGVQPWWRSVGGVAVDAPAAETADAPANDPLQWLPD